MLATQKSDPHIGITWELLEMGTIKPVLDLRSQKLLGNKIPRFFGTLKLEKLYLSHD